MAEGFVGEIRVFAGLRIPQNWLACNGQELNVSAYQALYALIGQTYGGNGSSTFNLPNLQGRLIAGAGQGVGLSSYSLGQTFGAYTVQLSDDQTAHSHTLQVSTAAGSSLSPQTNVYAGAPSTSYGAYVKNTGSPAPTLRPLDPALLSNEGAGQAHSNMMPSVAFNYIICVNGLYPTFN